MHELNNALDRARTRAKTWSELKVLCDGSRMRTTIYYVVIKPDSRPDGTVIRDHARVPRIHSSRERRCATNCESE